MKSKFRIYNYLLLSSLCYLGIACNYRADNKPPSVNDRALVFLYIGDERIFNQEYWGMPAAFWMFLPLVADVGNEKNEMLPVLAESWTNSEDYHTWTVTLRKDIYWHDGVKMTAHDIKFSLDLRKEVLGFNNGYTCEIIDDYTFKLINTKPMSSLPDWTVYYPKHLLEELDPKTFFDWDFWKNPVGNGPYRYVRHVPQTMVEVEANPNYFGKKPAIKKAILKFSDTPYLPELMSGNVDVITYAPRDFLFKIKDQDTYTSYYMWWFNQIETIFWNHNNLIFNDARVRKALTMAINRVELAAVLNYPAEVPITDVIFSERQKHISDFPEPVSYDPQKAIKLLDESGWKDTDGDGVLDKAGRKFRFSLMTGGANKLMATYIQDNLSKIGVLMEIETVEQIIARKMMEENDFDAVLGKFFHSENELQIAKDFFGEQSVLGYKNKRLANLIDGIEATGDIHKIDSLYKETSLVFQQDFPVTFILPAIETHIVPQNLKGLKNGYKADPVWFLESLWIE